MYFCFRKKNQMETIKNIETYPGFCNKCGSILPPLSMEEFVKCYSCKTIFGPQSKQMRFICKKSDLFQIDYILCT